MGGGGAMRAAAKVAGIGGSVSAGFRSGARGSAVPAPAAEQSVRNVSRSVPAIVSESQSGSMGPAVEDVGVQRPSWELDEWEFAGGEEELLLNSRPDPMPRVVFGGPPSVQEAKEATAELKDALEKVYLSSPTYTGYGGSLAIDQSTALPLVTNPNCLEAKPCVTSDPESAPVPKHAMKAFALLKENPVAQTVVASIASDPNVWDAVFKNEALVEFLQSQKTSASFPDMDVKLMESVADSEVQDHQYVEKYKELSDDASESVSSKSGLEDILQNIKQTVVDMVSNISGYLQNFFGFFAPEGISTDADGNARATATEKVLGASFLALAVMAIMVVVLKRG